MTIVLLVAVAAAVLSTFLIHRRLTAVRAATDAQWARLQTQRLRRHDLLPSLVTLLQVHAEHELGLIESVQVAREVAVASTAPAEQASAEAALSSTVDRVLRVTEAYPQLKADAQFRTVAAQLTGVDRELATAAASYNGSVDVYNDARRSALTGMVAGLTGFPTRSKFELAAATGRTRRLVAA